MNALIAVDMICIKIPPRVENYSIKYRYFHPVSGQGGMVRPSQCHGSMRLEKTII